MEDSKQTNATPPAQTTALLRPRLRATKILLRVTAAGFGLAVIAGLIWPVVWGEPVRSRPETASPETSSPETAQQAASVLRVDVIRPVPGGVRRLTIQPGSVHAFESVDLFAKASGFLKTQKVDIGSSIKQGELLAEIDAPELVADRDAALAALEQARAREDQAVARVATAESERIALEAAVSQSETDIARLAARRSLAQKQFHRIKELHAQNAVDAKLVDEHQQELEATTAAELTSHAAVKTARARASAAATKVLEAKADAAEARSAIRLAQAHFERAQVMVGYMRITAPFDGVITRRNFYPGAFIRSASEGTVEPLLTAARTDRMRVVIQVPDLDVPLLDIGDKATVAVDALKGREFHGAVSRSRKSEDPTTRTMRVEVDLPNSDGLLVDGMYGRATIELQPPGDRLTIPTACVVGTDEHGKAAVFVVRAGIAKRTAVTLGGDDGKSVEVLSGLGPNDDVIVRPGSGVRHNAAAQISVSQSAVAVRR